MPEVLIHICNSITSIRKGWWAAVLLLSVIVSSCARMGQPDGGWYDERPPQIIGSTPGERATNVTDKKIRIYFNEYIKLENASEKVVYCPPQMEMPELTTKGKSIAINLEDSLKPNTTYTIDFSDAITDNNEGNPMGNYTFVFSTGEKIDTMEVAGYVLNAQDLEPIKGILVGLYSNLSDTIFKSSAMERVARTNGAGKFLIRGVAPGSYRIAALEDSDGDYKLSQRGERLAFSHDIIVPSQKDDFRSDTIWQDALHIKDIKQTPYIHYLPDDVVLRAFNQTLTSRYLIKTERAEPDHFTMFFSYGSTELPEIRGLNFDSKDAFVIESSEKRDTITYWLRDTMLVNQDTLRMEVKYLMTDSLENLVSTTDTLEVLPKLSYEKRQKLLAEKIKDWTKAAEKARKKAEGSDKPADIPRRPDDIALEPRYSTGNMSANDKIIVEIPVPLAQLDTAGIHLYSKIDSLWYRSKVVISDKDMPTRQYKIYTEWRPGIEYSLEIDSAAFKDIYGHVSDEYKTGFKIMNDDDFSTLFVNMQLPDSLAGKDSLIMVQMLGKSDDVIKSEYAIGGTAEFYYIKPGEYYLRCFVDSNRNGKWDTGDYDQDLQPEAVYYHPEKVECKAKWDGTVNFDVSRPLYKQKPADITKQKPDKAKTIKLRNVQRAAQLGIIYDPTKIKQK